MTPERVACESTVLYSNLMLALIYVFLVQADAIQETSS